MPKAYPLQWPSHWPRAERDKRQNSRFKTTTYRALCEVETEVARLGGKNLVVSSNVTLGPPPKDPGVAAYFDLDGDAVCIPCDRWAKVEDNLHAIALTIEALRGIERWGAKHMVKAAFSGFAALPPPNASPGWKKTLGFRENSSITIEKAESAYKRLAHESHPDAGGSNEAMANLNRAIADARKEIGA